MDGEALRQAMGELAEEIKAWREARGWSQADLASQLGYAESTIAMVESSKRLATVQLGELLDKVLETPGTFTRMITRMRSGVSYPTAFGDFAQRERTATALYVTEHSLIPGLFQTEEYAREVLSRHPGVMPEVVDTRVAARIARQAILTRDDPPMVWCVLDEAVLYRQVGTAEVMSAQLARLAEIASYPRVTVQVISSKGAHPGLMGAFTIAEADGVPVAITTEDAVDGRTSEDSGMITEAMVRFRYCCSLAWPADASPSMIMKAEGP